MFIVIVTLSPGAFFWSVLDALDQFFADTDKIRAQTHTDCLPSRRMILYSSPVSLKIRDKQVIFLLLHNAFYLKTFFTTPDGTLLYNSLNFFFQLSLN